MLEIIGLGIGFYIAVLFTVLLFRLNSGIQQVKSLKQVISDKLKSKQEIVNGMSVREAKILYIRVKAIIFEILEEASPIISNAIAVALGGKKSSSGYREGR